MSLTCEDVVSQAGDHIDGALSAPERRVVKDHLDTCDDCSCYLRQLRTTINLLAARPGVVPERLRQAIDAAASDVASGVATAAREAVGEHGVRLLAVADAVDEGAAEDLVQATWERALAEGEDAFVYHRLVEILLDEADRKRANLSVDALTSAGEGQARDLDPDADAAELFYPHFYGDGPDTGSWVQSPRSWPSETDILSPEEDLTTSELYDVIDAALGEADGDGGRLVALVDIGGLDRGHAAETLGLEENAARRSLHAARNHLRAAVGSYLRASGG